MNIPLHQIENVLKSYKKNLVSTKRNFSQKTKNRFNEKKTMLRNKILMDIARRTANLRYGQDVLVFEKDNYPDCMEKTKVEYNVLGPNGKKAHFIDITDILNP